MPPRICANKVGATRYIARPEVDSGFTAKNSPRSIGGAHKTVLLETDLDICLTWLEKQREGLYKLQTFSLFPCH